MRSSFFRSFIVIIAFFLKFLCFGQFSNFQSINSKINIPSTETYQVMQDQSGFIWIATDAGACKYDGNELETFDENNGLTDNTVLGFFEDHKNRIWFRTYNNKLCYYLNKQLHTLPEKTYNDILQKTEANIITSVYVDSKDTLWLGLTNGNGYLKIYNHFKTVELVKLSKNTVYMINIENNGCIYGRSDALNSSREFTLYNKSKPIITYTLPNKIRHDFKYLYCYKAWHKNAFLFSHKNILFIKQGNSITTQEFESEIASMFMLDSVNVQLSTINKSVITYNLLSGKTSTEYIDEAVTSKLKDNEGGIWYATLSNGIFYAPSSYYEDLVKNSVLKENTILDFTTTAKHLIYINKNNTLTIKNRITGTQKQMECKTELYCLKQINDNLFFCGGYESFLVDTNGRKTYLYGIDKNLPINIIAAENSVNDELIGIGRTYIYMINGLSKKTEFVTKSAYRIRDAKKDKQGNLLIATIKGLFILKDQVLQPYFDTGFFANKRIESFTFDKEYNLWICLKKLGLYKYNVKTKTISHIGPVNADVYRHIYIDATGILWLSSSNGVFKIIPSGSKNYIYHYDKIDGLTSVDVKKIKVKNNKIYVLTNSDLFVVDPKMFNSEKKEIKDLLIKVTSDKTILNYRNPIELDYNSPINISLKALTFKYQEKITFFYSISDKPNPIWLPISDKSLLFPALKWGNYTINLKAFNSKNHATSSIKTIRVNIKTPYYFNWWFLSIVFILFLLTIYSIYQYNIIKQRKKLLRKNELELKISQLKLQAIKAQMNPHFISNTISSIQYYIMQNNIEKSFEYLSNFSGLIRMVFEMSFDEYISLKEELNMLKLYINLEQMRFDTPFEYDLQVDPEILKQNPKLPTMLLQPYIENAIIHGLMPKRQNTKLSLMISRDHTHLIIKIHDNGIGRKRSGELNEKKTTKSKGITLTMEKVSILNQNNDFKISVAINDLKNNEEPVGTEVIITLFNLLN